MTAQPIQINEIPVAFSKWSPLYHRNNSPSVLLIENETMFRVCQNWEKVIWAW